MGWLAERRQRRLAKDLVTLRDLADLQRQVPAAVLKSIRTSELLSTWSKGIPVQTDWTVEKAVADGMKVSVWVYACVYRLAKSAAAVPWYTELYQKGHWVQQDDHPLTRLFERPNPFWSRQDFMERLTMFLHLTGDGPITKVRGAGGGVPLELWLIAPDKIAPIPDPVKFVSGYQTYKDGVLGRVLPPEDVIWTQFTNPADPYRGLSPLQSAARAVDTDVAAAKWQYSSMSNRAVADGVLAFKDVELTPEQYEDAREKLREQNQGPDNARLPWLLGSDVSWHNISYNPVEMDYVRSRTFNRTEICAAFGCPPPVVGILDDATLANVKALWEMFWTGTILPYLDDVRDALNRSLAPEFGRNCRLTYDLSGVEALKGIFRDDVITASKLWLMGVPFNVINQRLRLGFRPTDIESGDKSYLPVNVYEYGTTPPSQAAGGSGGGDRGNVGNQNG